MNLRGRGSFRYPFRVRIPIGYRRGWIRYAPECWGFFGASAIPVGTTGFLVSFLVVIGTRSQYARWSMDGNPLDILR